MSAEMAFRWETAHSTAVLQVTFSCFFSLSLSLREGLSDFGATFTRAPFHLSSNLCAATLSQRVYDSCREKGDGANSSFLKGFHRPVKKVGKLWQSLSKLNVFSMN